VNCRDVAPVSKQRKGRPPPSSEDARRRMLAVRQRDTNGERALRRAIHSLGLRYRVDYALPGLRRRADVAFLRAKVAIFVDGCFWHGCPEHGTWPKANADWWRTKILANQQRDRDTDSMLRSSGWHVLRFWEHSDPENSARSVYEIVKGRK
jgi:DNA mismatch endonuclease (patch repair protein)